MQIVFIVRCIGSLKTLTLPPRIKVLEALGAIGDERVKLLEDGKHAVVVSSDGSRTYNVYVDIGKRIVYSNDNGTVYRGYVGYPIISVLMLLGVLPLDRDSAEKLKGIKWKSLNEKYKRYFIVEKIVKNIYKKRGGDPSRLDSFVKETLDKLKNIRLAFDEKVATPH